MANPVTWIMDQIKRLNDAIWHTPLSEISRGKTFLFKQLRIIVLAARGFSNDKVQLRASALTFYSLLSVIPVAAIAFAIAKGFGLDQNLKVLITEKFQAHQEVLNWLLLNATNAIQANKGWLYSRSWNDNPFLVGHVAARSYRKLIQSYMANQIFQAMA